VVTLATPIPMKQVDDLLFERPIALRASGLVKQYGSSTIVDHVNIVASKGELLALLGPSGCGKTTTLRMIAGLEEPDAGEIEINGKVVAGAKVYEPPERRQVGMVFQDGALFPHLSVEKNVGFGLRRGGDRRDVISDVLRLVGLAGYEQRMPYELSGGEQQRVALARALAPKPAVILLDEPFSSLDAELRRSLRVEVREILERAHATAVLVTHDQEEALSRADRVVVMWDGRVVQEASPEELYFRPATKAIGVFVGNAQFIPGVATGRQVDCVLGSLPTDRAASGAVDVMIRPESLRVSPPGDSAPANATVLSRQFFGHDQLLTVEFDAGCVLNVRLGTYGGVRNGSRIHVRVRGAVQTFPRQNET
jgi:iron(III) transport system ATP-binding protein